MMINQNNSIKKLMTYEEIKNLPYVDILNGHIHQMISVYDNETIFTDTICKYDDRIELEEVTNVDDIGKPAKRYTHIVELDIEKIKERLEPDMDWINEVILIYKKFYC